MTVDGWKRARRAVEMYKQFSNVYWAAAAMINPIQTGLRYLASQVGIGTPSKKLQENLLLWFYTSYVHRLGHYLIEVHSGRLRVGADKYRELLERHGLATDGPPPPPALNLTGVPPLSAMT